MKTKLLLSAATLALTPLSVAFITSCGQNTRTNIKEVTFQVKNSKTNARLANGVSNQSTPSEFNVYDPNYNQDAQSKVNNIKKDLSVANLQDDFKKVLQDFYEAYEVENKDIELELENVEVLSKETNGSFKLKVSYELEKETANGEKKEVKTLEINWMPKLVLIGSKQIEQIKQTILNYSKKDAASGIDLSDIKEIFLGEKDDDNDLDDFGVFDKINAINKNKTINAYLLGYEITLNDIFGEILKNEKVTMNNNKTIDLNTKFQVPSISLNTYPTIFYPETNSLIDYTLKSDLTFGDIKTLFEAMLQYQNQQEFKYDDTTKKTIIDTFNVLLQKPISEEMISGDKLFETITVAQASPTKFEIYIKYVSSPTPDLVVIEDTK